MRNKIAVAIRARDEEAQRAYREHVVHKRDHQDQLRQ